MIEREITARIILTPLELAKEFAGLNADAQALFFNHLYEITNTWKRPFCFQLQYITDSDNLTYEGRSIMSKIGEYSGI